MAITYLKKSPKTSSTDDTKTTGIVQDLLKDLDNTKEQGCIDLTKKFANLWKKTAFTPGYVKIKLNFDFAAGSLSIIDCKKSFII